MTLDPRRIPVIVGVGQYNDRRAPGDDGMDSVELMVESALVADRDAGGGFIARCDWLGVVPQISFRDLNPEDMVPLALGMAPHVSPCAMASGDTPVRHLNDAANAINRGQATVCLVTGGEALRTASRRNRTSGPGGGAFRAAATASDLRRRYGLVNAADIYPLYENATRPAWGQTLAQGQAETGMIWSLMSQVAADSEGAWIRSAATSDQIIEPTADNRRIAFPYNKLMVANSSVNQGASFIVSSLAAAREAGITDDRCVYVWAGASAHESEEPLERAVWDRPPSGMRVTLERVLQANRLTIDELDRVELYSCFPCVPKMARRVLGWPADRPATVHGGLTFGGGPIANYMSHAVVATVQALRQAGKHGLLYANGGHCTHNHAIVVSRTPPPPDLLGRDYDYQTEAELARPPIPAIGDDFEGPVTLETYTVFYDRSGAPTHGVVLARAPDRTRVVAKVDSAERAAIAFLTDGHSEPVGSLGTTERRGDTLFWAPSPRSDP